MGSVLATIAIGVSPIGVGPAGAASDAPFLTRQLRVPGRPVDAFTARFTDCPAPQLLVLAVTGLPPRESRQLSIFGCGAGRADPVSTLDVDPAVVALDVHDVDGDGHDELVQLTADGLRIRSLHGGDGERALPVPGGLPLPPRSRQLTRVSFVDDWESTGAPAALVPAADGGRLVPFDGRPPRPLPLPLVTNYLFADRKPPVDRELLKAELEWPTLARAHDDGDGRIDLFALARFDAWVYRADGPGLPAAPTRRMTHQPFPLAHEIRHEATDVDLYADDLDGDGLAELIVHRTMGTLSSSETITDVYANDGSGPSLAQPPAASLRSEGGIAGLEILDLDGDGRRELVEMSLRFSVVQMIRILVTQRAEVGLRVLAFRPQAEERGDEDPLVTAWRDDVVLRIDFGEGRIAGLFPDVSGDWNGDGRRDLLQPLGARQVGIRLGTGGPDGPGFESSATRQPLPTSGDILVRDLDADGLDDLVVYDPRDERGRVFVLTNRGRLPGTRPSLGPPASTTGAAAPPIPTAE
ncbi:MAG: VCBS repeat-containing protein [Proteobacteria bacterium]|nr:VCBS repeat-containing protein [Pseudomonadota bacterium]